MNYLLLFILSFSSVVSYAFPPEKIPVADTTEVRNLTKQAYNVRLTNPEETLKKGRQALTLAGKLKDDEGTAEALRTIGLGYYHLGQHEKALSYYLNALKYFKKNDNQTGQARLYRNIGNLYRGTEDDKAMEYFQESLKLAKKLKLPCLEAEIYLSTGSIYSRKKNYNLALNNYEKSHTIFSSLKDTTGVIRSLQNKGQIYFHIHDLNKSEQLLIEASKKAKEKDLNLLIARINLTLSAVYIAGKNYTKAEEVLKEGFSYASLIDNTGLERNYQYRAYELANARNDYQQALLYLQKVYKQDSIRYNSNVSKRIGLLQEQYRQQQSNQREELLQQRRENHRFLFWGGLIVAGLFLFMAGMLVRSIQRKAKTNKQLTVLNSEISQQKEELDWINQRLEQIIEERTKDLQHKNQKLSQYSWHLSHQIRGPIATMKGLMLLEKDELIESDEFIQEMDKCLEDIDYKILNINEMLHDPNVGGFSTPEDQTE